MLDLTHKSCQEHPGQKAQRSTTQNANCSFMSLFFDELCFAIKAQSLPSWVKSWILDRFSGSLENEYLGDLGNVDGFMGASSDSNQNACVIKDAFDKAMVEGNSNNSKAPKAELRYNIDQDDSVVYVKILSLFTSQDSKRRSMGNQLCPLLRLLTVAYDERYGGDGIGNIDALLGCPMLLPSSTNSSIDFRHLSEEQKLATLSSMFLAASWCREIINSFVYVAAFRPEHSTNSQITQEQECTREKIVSKISCLMDLEDDLVLCAKSCYFFAPPGLQPLSVPRELLSGNADSIANDDENICLENIAPDPIGRMSEEEKKAFGALKKAAKKKASNEMKSKQRRLKIKAKHEVILESRTRAALPPLSKFVSLALGFPEVRVGHSDNPGSQELMLSLGASELRNVKVGDRTTIFLLRLFNKSLESLFKQANVTSASCCDDDNPYSMSGQRLGTKLKDSNFVFLDLCMKGNVFLSIHERLVAAAEILGNDLKSDEDILECASLLFESVSTILDFPIPNFSGRGYYYFKAIFHQIADGDPACMRPEATRFPPFSRSAKALFDMLEEAVGGCKTDNLEFIMVGVSCMDALVRRALIIQSVTNGDADKKSFKELMRSMKMKLSTLCLGFLRREWGRYTTLNKGNLGRLLSLYLEHSSTEDPVSPGRQIQVMEWGRLKSIRVLIYEAMMELPKTLGCRGPVDSFATCSKSTFGYYLASVLTTLTDETSRLFQSPITKSNESASICLAVMQNLTLLMVQIFDLTKNNPELAKSSHLLLQVKHGAKFMIVLKRFIPFCIKHFQSHEDAIIELLETTQKVTRQLQFILSHGKCQKDSNLVREGPKVRKLCEEFLHNVKGLLKKNGMIEALWGGTLKNKNIDGSTILSSEDEDSVHSDNSSDHSSGTESEED